jgi:SAM-dependent methyltransferase
MQRDDTCRVCGGGNLEIIFQSPSRTSVTSVGTLVHVGLVVRLCAICGHGQSDVATATIDFMAGAYHEAARASVEPYVYRPGQEPVLRSEFIAGYVSEQLPLLNSYHVLECDANAGGFIRALHAKYPHLDCRVFAKTDHYSAMWSGFIPADRHAVARLPASWLAAFDIVVSNFDLAHSVEPLADCIMMRRALRPGGAISISVPDPFRNTGDILVANHVNHFTRHSLTTLLRRAGLKSIDVRVDLHPNRLVAFAVNRSEDVDLVDPPGADAAAFVHMGHRWTAAVQRLREFESALIHANRIAIYGAGFYGAFALSVLERPERVVLFLDGDLRRQGTCYLDRPIRAPQEVDGQFEALIVGLDPRVARDVIASSGLGRWPDVKMFFF